MSIAGAALAVILRMRGERLPARAHWGGLTLLGFLMICLGNGGVIWAEQWVPSGIAAVVVASGPFWMAGIESVSPGGERFTRRAIVGLLIGFTGIVAARVAGSDRRGRIRETVCRRARRAAGRLHRVGARVVVSKRHAREENALGAAALQMLFGGLLMLAFASVRGEWGEPDVHRAQPGRGGLSDCGRDRSSATPAYVYALKHLPVSTVSLYAYVNPVIAVALGALLLGEPFGARVVIASAHGAGGNRGGTRAGGSQRTRHTCAHRTARLGSLQTRGQTTLRPLTSRTRNSTTAMTSRTQMKLPSV